MQKKQENEWDNQRSQPINKELQEKVQGLLDPLRGRLSGISFFCSLCHDYLACSVTTFCKHNFCEQCLEEYLIFLNECPVCDSKLEDQKSAASILLDSLVFEYIKKLDQAELQKYQNRIQSYKDYKRRRTVGQLKAGDQTDIRDKEGVWCKGKVIKTINRYQQKMRKYLIIKYSRTLKKQEIAEYSPRLAPKGFFTSREDIPRYSRGKLILANPDDGVAYCLVEESESNSAQAQKKQN